MIKKETTTLPLPNCCFDGSFSYVYVNTDRYATFYIFKSIYVYMYASVYIEIRISLYQRIYYVPLLQMRTCIKEVVQHFTWTWTVYLSICTWILRIVTLCRMISWAFIYLHWNRCQVLYIMSKIWLKIVCSSFQFAVDWRLSASTITTYITWKVPMV